MIIRVVRQRPALKTASILHTLHSARQQFAALARTGPFLARVKYPVQYVSCHFMSCEPALAARFALSFLPSIRAAARSCGCQRAAGGCPYANFLGCRGYASSVHLMATCGFALAWKASGVPLQISSAHNALGAYSRHALVAHCRAVSFHSGGIGSSWKRVASS